MKINYRKRNEEYVKVKISVSCMLKTFQKCTPTFIKNVCKGRCCRKAVGPNLIGVLDSEVDMIVKHGGSVTNGMLDMNGKKCPFQKEDGMCKLYKHNARPFRCVSTPFILTKANTLVFRNKFYSYPCYDKDNGVIACEAFKKSLIYLFGAVQTDKLIEKVKKGGRDFSMLMPKTTADKLNDKAAYEKSMEEYQEQKKIRLARIRRKKLFKEKQALLAKEQGKIEGKKNKN